MLGIVRIWATVAVALVTSIVVTGVTALAADEYVIGAEDELQISFWQDPTLDQRVQVRQDGKITLSIIGELTASGLTPRQLADQIERSVSLYNSKISQATVTVVGFNSQRLYIAGQVLTPGKRTYEVIPDLWTVIKEAGGATENGDLTRVTVVRSQESGGEVITVNVLEAVASGNMSRLPVLRSGDTIEIPRMAGGVPGRQLAVDYSERKNLFYVIGQVNNPGPHPYEGETDILDAIGAAGGMTDQADLKKVDIISKNGDGSTAIRTDLRKYKSEGQARRIVIKPEDTIVIGEKRQSILSWSVVRDVVTLGGTVVTIVLLLNQNNNNNSGN
jgi:polysaccharide export outer membrane protein